MPSDIPENLIALLHAVVNAGVYDEESDTWTPGALTVELSYNGIGPFSVPCLAVPEGEFTTAFVQLTTGPDLITGLEDVVGNPIPDGWTFPAVVFVEGGVIYDIIAINPFIVDSAVSGIMFWESPGVPILVINQSMIFMPGMATSDPAIAGALWNDSGTVKVSSG